MKIEERKNEARDLTVPPDFIHGDHQPLTASIQYVSERWPGGRRSSSGDKAIDGVNATVTVRCSECCWNARATQFKSADDRDPNAFFRETTVANILVQALNNFRSKVPASCADALAAFVLTS